MQQQLPSVFIHVSICTTCSDSLFSSHTQQPPHLLQPQQWNAHFWLGGWLCELMCGGLHTRFTSESRCVLHRRYPRLQRVQIIYIFLNFSVSLLSGLCTVCKSCLVKHLEDNSTCPTCESVIHQSHPLQYISFDRTMQDIVYKLVPNLQEGKLVGKNVKIGSPMTFDCLFVCVFVCRRNETRTRFLQESQSAVPERSAAEPWRRAIWSSEWITHRIRLSSARRTG